MSKWTEHVGRQSALAALWPEPLEVGPNKRPVARITKNDAIEIRGANDGVGTWIEMDATDALELLDWLKDVLEPR